MSGTMLGLHRGVAVMPYAYRTEGVVGPDHPDLSR